MGTRHLIAVVHGGQYKIAQYGQWDGYPSGQGVNVLQFCRDVLPARMAEFKTRLDALKALDDEELKRRWTECGAKPDSEFVSMEVSRKFTDRYPWLSRDAGSKILHYVLDGTADGVRLSVEFAADSLFCEWAYVLDLDAEVLEVYTGFQETAHSEGRFASLASKEREYFPVRLLRSLPLSALPSDAEFLQIESKDDDSEDE